MDSVSWVIHLFLCIWIHGWILYHFWNGICSQTTVLRSHWLSNRIRVLIKKSDQAQNHMSIVYHFSVYFREAVTQALLLVIIVINERLLQMTCRPRKRLRDGNCAHTVLSSTYMVIIHRGMAEFCPSCFVLDTVRHHAKALSHFCFYWMSHSLSLMQMYRNEYNYKLWQSWEFQVITEICNSLKIKKQAPWSKCNAFFFFSIHSSTWEHSDHQNLLMENVLKIC